MAAARCSHGGMIRLSANDVATHGVPNSVVAAAHGPAVDADADMAGLDQIIAQTGRLTPSIRAWIMTSFLHHGLGLYRLCR